MANANDGSRLDHETLVTINWLSCEELVSLLESVGIACFDHESTHELREAVRANVMDGMIAIESLEA